MNLGTPYSTKSFKKNNNASRSSSKHSQSYVWRVKVFEKRILLSNSLYKTAVFTNKVAAINYQNKWNNQKGYYAVVEKYDPIKR